MKMSLGAHCDELYISSRLFLKMDLPLERETVLHFFDRIRREFPGMRRFRRREDGALILDENGAEPRGSEPRRWVRLEPGAVRFGYFAPPSPEAYRQFAGVLLDNAPHHLTLNDLDIEYIELVFGFDLEYSGNHDRLVAETLFADHPFSGFLLGDDAFRTIDCQPGFGISLNAACDTHAYLEIKSRTTTFEVRTSDFESQPLSVYLTIRRYWSATESGRLATAFGELADIGEELAIRRVIPTIVNPLALAIGSRQ